MDSGGGRDADGVGVISSKSDSSSENSQCSWTVEMGNTKAEVLGAGGVIRGMGVAAAKGFVEDVPEVERGSEGIV